MSTLVRWSVLAFSAFNLVACAYGSQALTYAPLTKDDAGVKVDAAAKDAGKDVATAKDSDVDAAGLPAAASPAPAVHAPAAGQRQSRSATPAWRPRAARSRTPASGAATAWTS